MKTIFYTFTLFPLKLAFLVLDIVFKFIPLSILKFLGPFKITKKNLSIAFPELNDHELDLLAKES